MLGEGVADDTNGIVETAEKKISINYSKFKFKFDKKVKFFYSIFPRKHIQKV